MLLRKTMLTKFFLAGIVFVSFIFLFACLLSSCSNKEERDAVPYEEFAEYLTNMRSRSPENPAIMKLAPLSFSTTNIVPGGFIGWAEINRTVKKAEKYVILDLSDCSASYNIIKSSSSFPRGQSMDVMADNPYIKGIILPSTLEKIEEEAFRGCKYLNTVTILDGTVSIGRGAFAACTNLSSVSIPDSVTTIESHTFISCSSLVSVIIPDGVTIIGTSTFLRCSSLTNVTIPGSVTVIGNWAFQGCSNLTNVTIPNGVTIIGEQAFSSCTNLVSVTIPDSVLSIEKAAFQICPNLTTITIPAGITSIKEHAFDQCFDLVSVTFEKDGIAIEDDAFPENNDYGGNTLRELYRTEGTGTYARVPGGNDWKKVSEIYVQ